MAMSSCIAQVFASDKGIASVQPTQHRDTSKDDSCPTVHT